MKETSWCLTRFEIEHDASHDAGGRKEEDDEEEADGDGVLVRVPLVDGARRGASAAAPAARPDGLGYDLGPRRWGPADSGVLPVLLLLPPAAAVQRVAVPVGQDGPGARVVVVAHLVVDFEVVAAVVGHAEHGVAVARVESPVGI